MRKDKKEDNNLNPEEENNKENESSEGSSEQEPESEVQPMVALSVDEYDGLQKQIDQLQSQADEYLDGLQRERANFANYKKRIDQESVNTYNNALSDFVKNFLYISDDLERALNNRPADSESTSWVNGIELIHQKLLNTLETHGLERIKVSPGDEFDPKQHEAVTYEDNSNYENGQIIEVLQPGYQINEHIIRPALVRVAK